MDQFRALIRRSRHQFLPKKKIVPIAVFLTDYAMLCELHAQLRFIFIIWASHGFPLKFLKVDKCIFAQLLGIKNVDGSLFYQQGNFPSHGFIEIGYSEALRTVAEADLEGVDYERVRLLVHHSRIFVRDATEEDLTRCNWVHDRLR
jgi:hypothetical protein